MIPQLLIDQNRTLELTTKKLVLGQPLSHAEEIELTILEGEAEKAIKRTVSQGLRQAREVEAHRRRTRGLSIGNYSCAA